MKMIRLIKTNVALMIVIVGAFVFFMEPASVNAAIPVTGSPNGGTMAGTNLFVGCDSCSSISVINTVTNTVTDTITVGIGPTSSILSGTKLYVNNVGSNTVSVIDTITKTVIETISVGSYPNPGTLVGTKLYTSNVGSDDVSVIDTTTDTVIDTVSVGSVPGNSIAVGTKLYVKNTESANVSVIDTTTDTVVATISVGNYPSGSTVVGTDLYVGNYQSGTISVIDTNTDLVTDTITVGSGPGGSILVGTDLYTTNQDGASLSVIDTNTNTVTDTVPVGVSPFSPVLIGTSLYISSYGSSSVTVVNTNTNTVTDTIVVGTGLRHLVNVGSYIYALDYGGGRVAVIDTSTNTLVPTGPLSLLYSEINDDIVTIHFDGVLDVLSVPAADDFVVDSNGTLATVTNIEIDGADVILTIDTPVGTCAGYSYVEYTPGIDPIRDTRDVEIGYFADSQINNTPCQLNYVAGPNGSLSGDLSQSVAIGNSGTEITAIPGTGYRFVDWSDTSTDNPRFDYAYDNLNVTANFELIDCSVLTVESNPGSSTLVGTKLYVNNEGSGTVSVIDTITNTIVDTITVGSFPRASVLVGVNLYVINLTSSSVSVIDTTTDTVIDTINSVTLPDYMILVGTDLYIHNQSNNSFYILDTTNNTVTGTTPVGVNYSYSSTLVDTQLYVNNVGGNTISVVDTATNTIVDTITVGSSPNSSTLVGTELYVNNVSGTISVIDTATNLVVDTISFPADNFPVYSVLVGTRLYVSNISFFGTDSVSVIDTTTNTILTAIDIGSGDDPKPATLVGTKLYVNGGTGADTVSIVDTTDDSAVIVSVGYSPNSSTLVGTKLYVNNIGDSIVSVIDTTTDLPYVCTLYNCSYSAGSGGTVTGNLSQTVYKNGDATAITAVADSGYSFAEWSDNVTDNPRMDTNVTGDITVSAIFTANPPDTFTVTYTAGPGGTLTGDISQTLNENADGTAVTAVPNPGYTFTRWSDSSTQNPRTDTNVTDNISVSAIFTATRSGRGSSGGGVTYGCKDPKATNYNAFSSSKPSLCKYAATPVVPVTPGTLGKPGICSVNQLLTQNLKTGARNGRYHPYTKGTVKEAHILQVHLNRLGFNSGKEDGILGPISTGAIKRMQTFLKTTPDGYVGPITRGLLNNSCGEKGLSN